MSTILTLLGIASFLLLAELVLPGGILGVIGGVLIFIAGLIGVKVYGIWVGLAIWGLGGLCICLLIWLEMKILSSSRLAGRFLNSAGISEGAMGLNLDRSIIGKKGVTLTTMVPGGKVEIEGQIYAASAIEGYLSKGTSIVVKEVSSFNLIVSTQ